VSNKWTDTPIQKQEINVYGGFSEVVGLDYKQKHEYANISVVHVYIPVG